MFYISIIRSSIKGGEDTSQLEAMKRFAESYGLITNLNYKRYHAHESVKNGMSKNLVDMIIENKKKYKNICLVAVEESRISRNSKDIKFLSKYVSKIMIYDSVNINRSYNLKKKTDQEKFTNFMYKGEAELHTIKTRTNRGKLLNTVRNKSIEEKKHYATIRCKNIMHKMIEYYDENIMRDMQIFVRNLSNLNSTNINKMNELYKKYALRGVINSCIKNRYVKDAQKKSCIDRKNIKVLMERMFRTSNIVSRNAIKYEIDKFATDPFITEFVNSNIHYAKIHNY